MNPSSREIYIVGVFDCGCNYDACFSSVEIVRCSNTAELDDIKRRMNKHSSEYQCEFRHALSLLVFEGKLKSKFKGVRNYKGYIRAWNARNKDGRKTTKELKQLDNLWDRKWKWMQREKIDRDKVIAQENINTGVGTT
jgi:hypothetical protein